ncbi:MAG: carboxypeptidase regulatory-like domain-containing protein, partial [Acidobacteria bacterium]|nr:carboxypeptidase regulatory-like domain-containing protein [Acidobacteriota bacterium]
MGKSTTVLRFVASLFVAISTIQLAPAQQITGTLRGSIVDPNGEGVGTAIVTATLVETGLVRTTSADREGNYVFLELPVGHYQLQAQSHNFEKYLRQGISLNVNQVATVNVELRVGSDTQTVEVR